MADNLKFEYSGKKYNTADRSVSGQSAREYWAGITGNDKSKYPGSSSSVKNLDDAKNFINSGQSLDTSTSANAPEIRKSLDTYQGLTKDILGYNTKDLKSPELPNFEQTYSQLRNDKGLTALEDSMNGLQSEADAVKTQFYINKNAEGAKSGMTPENVVSGRVGEHEKATNERLMILDDQITTINNQLNTAYGVINNIVQYKGMDYDAAVKHYDTQFSQYMQTVNMVKGIDDSVKTEQQHQQAVASANLAIMYNNISESSQGWKSLSKSQQTQVSKLEAQSGLPQGFYKTIESKNPGGKILSTTERTDASGNKYIDTITIDQKTGQPKTQSTFVGQSKVAGSGGGDSAPDRLVTAKGDMVAMLDTVKGSDGFISPESWDEALSKWSKNTQFGTSQFIDAFGGYVNPAHSGDYRGVKSNSNSDALYGG